MLGSNALGMVLGALVTGASVTGASVFAQDGIHTVIGELLQYQVGGFLVRDANGRDVHIEVSEETKMNPAPLVGDQIEAEIAANGIAMAITKLDSSRNQGASQPSATIARESDADENLRYRIEERLRSDGRLDWEVLGVQVNRGEVTLYGEVQTDDQKGLASLIATTVPGVVSITDSIIVEPGPYTKDHGLQRAIWQNLWGVDALRQQMNRLKVQVKSQVATLSGSVERSLQKKEAEKAAEAVPGVEKVINVIQVRHLEPVRDREKLREQGIEEMP